MKNIKPHKMKESEMSLEPSKEMYPYFNISIEHLPEAKDWKIGNEYIVTLKLKQTGLHLNKYEEKETGDASFDITGIEVGGSHKKNYKELPDKY